MRSYLLPHVPYLLPELGGNRVRPHIKEIYSSFDQIRSDIRTNPPDCILICSPHFEGSVFNIGHSLTYKSNLSNFKRPDIVDIRTGAKPLSDFIQKKGEDIGFLAPVSEVQEEGELDYGSIVPLRLVDPKSTIPIIPISISLGTKKEHYLWGRKLAKIVSEYSQNVMFIASTELTQDFKQDPVALPSNSEEDEKFIKYLLSHDIDKMIEFPQRYFANTERELLPVFILSGFSSSLDGNKMNYSGFIGCGCATIKFS